MSNKQQEAGCFDTVTPALHARTRAVWLFSLCMSACSGGVDPCELQEQNLANAQAGSPSVSVATDREALLTCEPPPPHARCGNGKRERGEACDDGNTVGSDGCSSTCELDDIATTPGDDRAGYVECFGATCEPGSFCCGAPLGCVPDGGACQLRSQACDGPEDCPPPTVCFVGMVGRTCSTQGLATVCHTDRDCTTALCPGPGTPCPVCDANSGSCGN